METLSEVKRGEREEGKSEEGAVLSQRPRKCLKGEKIKEVRNATARALLQI